LDYLARDAYFCGLTQRYDQRIFHLFGLEQNGSEPRLYLDAQRDGVLRQDALSEVIHLLRLRYFLSERVYFHHTKTVSGAMISRAVEEAVGQGLTLDEIATQTDEGLWTVLESRFGALATVGHLMRGLRSRKLYKRVFLLTAELSEERRQHFAQLYHHDATRRSRAEAELARACKLKPEHLIVYCPALKMQLKEGRLPVKVDGGPPGSLDQLPVDEIGVLKQRHRLLWRFYVFLSPDQMGKADVLAKACEGYFGEANHLPRFRSGQLFLGV
jgi:HD superfamily phosphohydrolase